MLFAGVSGTKYINGLHPNINIKLMMAKVFTLEEANRILPDLAKVFEKISGLRVKIELIKEALDYSGQTKPDFQESPQKLIERMNLLSEELKKYVNDIQSHGCIVKDLENYLIDFYSVLDNKPVFLCWRYGEDKISYWHDQQAGARGRQPLSAIREEIK